jgi:hypothetical protein
MAGMRCPHCGADNAPAAALCQYCGAHLPQAAPAAMPERAEAFARIRKSAAFAESNSPARHARLPKIHPAQKVLLFGFFGVFIAVALVIFVMALGMGGAFGLVGWRMGGGPGGALGILPMLMAIVPLGMAAVGVFLFLTVRKKMQTLETAPVVAVPVIVTDKRTHVSGGGQDHSARTDYFVTCEVEDGSRKEYQAWDGNLYGRMAPQDAGIVYLRADHALDFDRVTI